MRSYAAGGHMRLKRRLTCWTQGLECAPTLEYSTHYTSPDGKVFEVRRLRCPQCGDRTMSAQRHTASTPNPAWMGDAEVQANYRVARDGRETNPHKGAFSLL